MSAVVTAWTESEIVWLFLGSDTRDQQFLDAVAVAMTMLACLATLGVSVRFKKVPEPVVILAAGAVGMVLGQTAGHPPGD